MGAVLRDADIRCRLLTGRGAGARRRAQAATDAAALVQRPPRSVWQVLCFSLCSGAQGRGEPAALGERWAQKARARFVAARPSCGRRAQACVAPAAGVRGRDLPRGPRLAAMHQWHVSAPRAREREAVNTPLPGGGWTSL
jgi:hypothetical protein